MPKVALSEDFQPGEHVLCAVSGGADSVALLLLLKEKADRGEIRLTVAHFDHRIRSGSADDARFVRELCKRLAVPLLEGSEDVPKLARVRRIGLETAARDARRAFLEDARRKAGADVIATAHHLDDQAETVLMHLFRGTGTKGAAGIRPRAGVWVHPLLHTLKTDLILFLKERSQEWRTDETNAILDTPRNRLRSVVLPEIKTIYPGAEAAISRFAEISAEESDFLDRMADDFLKENGTQIDLGLYALKVIPAHRALVRRALRRYLPESDHSIITRLADLYFSPQGIVKASGVNAERSGGRLYLTDERVNPDWLLGTIHTAPAENRPEYSNGFRQVLDRRSVENAVLRTRMQGDRISPLGTNGSKSLSDYLTDRKIDRPLRDRLPLLADGHEILWVIGVGISNHAALRNDSEALELTYIPKQDGGTPHDA